MSLFGFQVYYAGKREFLSSFSAGKVFSRVYAQGTAIPLYRWLLNSIFIPRCDIHYCPEDIVVSTLISENTPDTVIYLVVKTGVPFKVK